MPKALDDLVQALSALPGIGRKSATRLAFHILKRPPEESLELASRIVKARENLRHCKNCGYFSETDICEICSHTGRDRSLICVVEESSDVVAIESTDDYRGLYHVLGGALSPLDGIGPEDLNIESLRRRIDGGEIREIILATNPSTEGEATASYITSLVRDSGIKITRIARGLPAGGSLEFADKTTLSRALENRTTQK
jgi:recombination protein RecR